MTDYSNQLNELLESGNKKAFEHKDFENLLCNDCFINQTKCKVFRKMWKNYKPSTYDEDKAEEMFDNVSTTYNDFDEKEKRSFNDKHKHILEGHMKKNKKEVKVTAEDFLEQQACHTFEKYLQMKKYFEVTEGWCKVNSPTSVYGKIVQTNEGSKFEIDSNPQAYFKNKNFTNETEKNGKTSTQKFNFFQVWEQDPEIKTYERIVFDPTNSNPRDLNLFCDYGSVLKDKERKLVSLERFFEHTKSICGYEMECYEYLLNYFAHIFQKPHIHCDVATVMYGKEGIGKNMLLQLIGSTIGSQYYKESAVAKDVFGEFATGMYRKMMYVFDEAEKSQTKDYMSLLKTLVTGRKLRVEFKGKDMIEVDNYCRLFFPTNCKEPFPITSNGRRWFYVKGSSKYIESENRHEHFKSLGEHFEDKNLIFSVAKFLSERDITNFNTNEFPKSEGLKQAIQVPLILRCFHSMILSKEEHCDKKFGATKLLEIILRYCKDNNYSSNAYNLTTLGNELQEYIDKKIVTKKRDSNGMKYTFDKEAFKKHIIDSKYNLEDFDIELDVDLEENKTTLEQMLDEMKELQDRLSQKRQRFLAQCEKKLKGSPLDYGIDKQTNLSIIIQVTPVKAPEPIKPVQPKKKSKLNEFDDDFVMNFD
jgi:hypothetical protein